MRPTCKTNGVPFPEERHPISFFLLLNSHRLRATDERKVKNRLHLDLRPENQQAEVQRALALGARHVDIGQEGSESWVVLADPEGNEFCILKALPQE